ncbi:MAG: hypothetical protein V9H69_04250 [Anaerolineae bacterium]
MRWILDIHRNLPLPDTARGVTTQLALEWADRGVVALGLSGNAGRGCRGRDVLLRPGFQRAPRRPGLRSTPQLPASWPGRASVWCAVRDLQADRIGHGVRSIEDPHLLAFLLCTNARSPVDVNPTSSGLFWAPMHSPEQHPFIHLLRMGLCVTVNSHHPPLFNTTLTQEYQRLAETFGLDAATCNA